LITVPINGKESDPIDGAGHVDICATAASRTDGLEMWFALVIIFSIVPNSDENGWWETMTRLR